VFLVTSVLGLTGLWIAILADTGATAIVTANALRLLGFFRSGRPSAGGSAAYTREGIEPATA
jgi:Cd2+/Zn2+-exporting ATPase